MDCNHARLLLHFVRPGHSDLAAEDQRALQDHLQGCSVCGSYAQAENEADRAIAQSMVAVSIPAGLRERVLESVTKSDPGRTRRRWLGGMAAAAALFVTVSLAWFLWLKPLPRLDFDDWVPVAIGSARDVEAWFAEKGVDMAAPRQFDYNLLSSFDTVLMQGQRVPRLLFARAGRGGTAEITEVFVLSDVQFDLQNLPDSGPSGRSMKIEYPDKPGFAFLILFSGDSLEPFRVAAGATQE